MERRSRFLIRIRRRNTPFINRVWLLDGQQRLSALSDLMYKTKMHNKAKLENIYFKAKTHEVLIIPARRKKDLGFPLIQRFLRKQRSLLKQFPLNLARFLKALMVDFAFCQKIELDCVLAKRFTFSGIKLRMTLRRVSYMKLTFLKIIRMGSAAL
jgi:hypothetical protein